jgi:hypothetical protein
MKRSKELVFVLERCPALSGRVLDADGRPIKSFTISVGPGPAPQSWDVSTRNVQEDDGRFRSDLPTRGEVWAGIRAPGYARWERTIKPALETAPLEVRLAKGMVVTASILAPPTLLSGIKASLEPRRDRTSDEPFSSGDFDREFAKLDARPQADGSLRFDNVRPDRYRFTLEGKGIPKTDRALDLDSADVDLGAFRFDVPAATGRIEGRFWKRKDEGGGPWAFAKGYVGDYPGFNDSAISLPLVADEEGRFKVDNVPVGTTTVGIPWQFFDVAGSYTWTVQVVAGKTTVVRGFEPDQPRKLVLDLAVGDGSKAQYESGTGLGAERKVENVTVKEDREIMIGRNTTKPAPPQPHPPLFRVELRTISKNSLAIEDDEWQEINDKRQIVLPDVGAGTYRLRLSDWLGWRDLKGGYLFDKEIAVPEGVRQAIHVPLGAGSITGKIPPPKETYNRPVEVTAISRGERAPSPRVRCDDEGNFCVRYLAPGIYTLFVHDLNAGYCRVDDIVVPAGTTDVGEKTLNPGATVTVSIQFARPSLLPDAVVATDDRGVTVTRSFEGRSSNDQINIPGLWPGRWNIEAVAAEIVIARGTIEIKGGESKSAKLVAPIKE